jgi:hypothetical protein
MVPCENRHKSFHYGAFWVAWQGDATARRTQRPGEPEKLPAKIESA